MTGPYSSAEGDVRSTPLFELCKLVRSFVGRGHFFFFFSGKNLIPFIASISDGFSLRQKSLKPFVNCALAFVDPLNEQLGIGY